MQSSYTEGIKSSMQNQETDYIIDILKSNSESGTLKEFKDGLSELIRNKGYSDKEDPFKEAAFIYGKLKEICPEPEKIITKESLNAWFSGKKVPECNVKGKRTMLTIAFALNMTVDEVETFFRKTFFGTPFNFRSAEDDIMYYCLKFGKTYKEAEKLISEYNAKISDVTEDNTQHTGVLKEKITNVSSDDELMEYLITYVPPTERYYRKARDEIRKLVKYDLDLARFDCDVLRLMDDMRKLWTHKILEDIESFSKSVSSISEVVEELNKTNPYGKIIKDKWLKYKAKEARDYVHVIPPIDPDVVKNDPDAEPIQVRIKKSEINKILDSGVYNPGENYSSGISFLLSIIYQCKLEREKSFFSSELELKKSFSRNFPRKMELSKILNEKSVSSEIIRKALILLQFYKYFKAKKIQNKRSEMAEFESEMNDKLEECGFQILYAGNPYDALFYYCMLNAEGNYYTAVDCFADVISELTEEIEETEGTEGTEESK